MNKRGDTTLSSSPACLVYRVNSEKVRATVRFCFKKKREGKAEVNMRQRQKGEKEMDEKDKNLTENFMKVTTVRTLIKSINNQNKVKHE